MRRGYTVQECYRKADQHYEMAGLAVAEGDGADAKRHNDLAALWNQRAARGGWIEGENDELPAG